MMYDLGELAIMSNVSIIVCEFLFRWVHYDGAYLYAVDVWRWLVISDDEWMHDDDEFVRDNICMLFSGDFMTVNVQVLNVTVIHL